MHLHLPRNAAVAVALTIGIHAAAMHSAAAAQAAGPQPLDAVAPITYFIAEGTGRTSYRAADRQLALWALEAWQRSANGTFALKPAASEAEALVRVYWAEASGGQYGEMRALDVGGRRGAAVFIRPDVNGLGDAIAERTREDGLLRDAIVYLTCLHELGHALGFPHTNDVRDIMYSFGYGGNVVDYFGRYRAQINSRTDIARTSGLSDADVRRLRLLYPAPSRK